MRIGNQIKGDHLRKEKKVFYGRVIEGPRLGTYGRATKMVDRMNKAHIGWSVMYRDQGNITFFIRPSAFKICTKKEYETALVIEA